MVTSVESANAAFIAQKEKEALTGATTTTSTTTAQAAQNQLTSDMNFFLKMLTTQLENQDPTEPMDTAQFTAQIAQYSGIQQQVVTNSNLEKLLSASKQSSVTTAVGYISKEVESAGNTGEVISGQGAFAYILPKAAKSAEITIKNESGTVVYKGNGGIDKGRNIAVWDGINSTTGQQEPDGTYTISIAALDADNKPITAETRAVGIVSGVETDKDGNVLLTIGRKTLNFSDVLAVRTPVRLDFSGGGEEEESAT